MYKIWFLPFVDWQVTVKSPLSDSHNEVENICFFHLRFVLYEKDNNLCFKGFAMWKHGVFPRKIIFAVFYYPRKNNQHAKSGWKCSDRSQTKWITLFILVNDAVLWNLLCSGKRGCKGSCGVNLLALPPQEGPHPNPPSSYSSATSCTGCSLQNMSISQPCCFGGRGRGSAPRYMRWRWAIQHLCPCIRANTPRLSQEGMAREVHISASALEKADTHRAHRDTRMFLGMP